MARLICSFALCLHDGLTLTFAAAAVPGVLAMLALVILVAFPKFWVATKFQPLYS